jgi:hypothetical protein
MFKQVQRRDGLKEFKIFATERVTDTADLLFSTVHTQQKSSFQMLGIERVTDTDRRTRTFSFPPHRYTRESNLPSTFASASL